MESFGQVALFLVAWVVAGLVFWWAYTQNQTIRNLQQALTMAQNAILILQEEAEELDEWFPYASTLPANGSVLTDDESDIVWNGVMEGTSLFPAPKDYWSDA